MVASFRRQTMPTGIADVAAPGAAGIVLVRPERVRRASPLVILRRLAANLPARRVVAENLRLAVRNVRRALRPLVLRSVTHDQLR